jgi:DNA-binding transcriptional ArsR family regulator
MAVRQIRRAVPTAATKKDICEVQCIDPGKVRAVRNAAPATRAVQSVAATFKLLGDGTRLRIIDALSRAELCVCDLALIVGSSQSNVSHALRDMRDMRLVRYRKDGKVAYYSLDDEHVGRLLSLAFEHAAESR